MKRLEYKRGSAYIIVLVAVVTGLILGLAATDIATYGTRLEARRMTSEQAALLADAGMRYAFWQIEWNGVTTRPYTTSLSYGGGAVTASVYDNSANLAVTDRIVVSATYKGRTTRLSRVVSRQRTLFDNALCVSGATGVISVPIVTSNKADLYLPGSPTFNNSSTNLAGDVYATGSISVASGTLSGTPVPNYSGFSFPLIDTTWFYQQARLAYPFGKTYSNITFSGDGDIIYVSGTLTLTGGTVSGKGTIVAAGGINITGNYDPGGDSVLALLTTGNATLQSTCSKFTGILYAHSSFYDSRVTLVGDTQLKGPVLADNIYASGAIISDYDAGKFNPSTFRLLHIPGY